MLPQPAPTIRSDNPPLANLTEYNRITTEDPQRQDVQLILTAIALCFTFALILVAYAIHRDDLGTIAVFMVVVMIIIGAVKLLSKPDDELEKLRAPIPLFSYNVEFTAPLLDNSTIRITVYFQIPRELGGSTQDPKYAVSASMEELNRLTENILIRFCKPLDKPPPEAALQDHLSHELVRFQDENKVAVLRIDVPLVIVVPPERTRSVNV
jgi:hypothetical protein